MRQKYYFRTFIYSNSQTEILVSFSRSTNVNLNMSFPNSNFEGNFSTYAFGNSFDIIETWKVNVRHRDIYYAINIKFFICVEIWILCKKVKYVWSSNFPKAITTKIQIWNDSFVFKYPVPCKKKFQNSH